MSYAIVVNVRPRSSTTTESDEKVATTVFTGTQQECTDMLPRIQAGWDLLYSDETVSVEEVT